VATLLDKISFCSSLLILLKASTSIKFFFSSGFASFCSSLLFGCSGWASGFSLFSSVASFFGSSSGFVEDVTGFFDWNFFGYL